MRSLPFLMVEAAYWRSCHLRIASELSLAPHSQVVLFWIWRITLLFLQAASRPPSRRGYRRLGVCSFHSSLHHPAGGKGLVSRVIRLYSVTFQLAFKPPRTK